MGKKGRGRPRNEVSLYEKYVEGKEALIVGVCRAGADNNGIANVLGVSLATLKRIRKEHPEVEEYLKEGKDEADFKVESALYKRALGYEIEETETEVRVGEDGSAQTTFVKKRKKHVPGDTTAQIFWLKNRNPRDWRDKQEVSVTNNEYIEALKALSKEYKKDEPGDTATDK